MATCDQCGTSDHTLYLTEYGRLCDLCAYRQDERSEYGYGLSASSYGFLSESE